MNKQQSQIFTTLWAFHPLTQIISGVGLILGGQGFQESVMVIYWISQNPNFLTDLNLKKAEPPKQLTLFKE